MATLTIRDLDESLKRKLRLRAADQNRSMEEEARQILRAALEGGQESSGAAFYARIRERFAGLGDVVLPIEPREPVRTPPVLQEIAAEYAAQPRKSTKPRKPTVRRKKAHPA